ncbi:MAG: hypothetical protein JJT93_08185 [Gammaproteobacteria bacterium]|nr:hypothetical protein [Gammaproteobacteria bacterium]
MSPALRITALLLLCSTAWSASRAETTVVREPHYGEVLFHFYVGQPFEAITRIEAGRVAGHIEFHDEEAELLLGGMLLDWGQHREAARIFVGLLETTRSAEVRDRAWLELARLSWQRGALAQAQTALARIGDTLSPGRAAERAMIEAQLLMAIGQYAQASERLARWDGPADWRAYAQFNHGVALVRQGRLEEGLRTLETVGARPGRSPELRALADRANVALGFTLLEHGRPDDARAALERVRLHGPHSSEALLGFGWAESALGRHRESLTPWLTLRERDLLDPAVQESLLAIPHAFASLSAYGQAAEAYLAAIDTLDTELGRIERAITAIRDGALVPALLARDDQEQLGWHWQLDALPDSLESRYLAEVIATHEFQEGLKNTRDLAFVRSVLLEWGESLGAFADMVATQQLAWQSRAPRAEALMARSDVAGMQARRDALASTLERAVQHRDTLALAGRDEQLQLEELDEVAGRLAPLDQTDPDVAELVVRERVMRGVLLWQLNAEFPARVWQQTRELRDLEPVLDEMAAREARIETLRDGAEAAFEDQARRIVALGPRVAALLEASDAASVRQRAHLENLAVASLERQASRLRSHQVQARFALARIYDRAAAGEVAATRPEGSR